MPNGIHTVDLAYLALIHRTVLIQSIGAVRKPHLPGNVPEFLGFTIFVHF